MITGAQGDCEKICEVQIEGHGLVQIFRSGERFAARIVERTGPFSRTSTVPIYCKGLCDPEKATRQLTHLPQSALRHLVHVLSDRARGVDRFVFLGDLGVRGGGAGQSSSGRAAHEQQTTAETTASSSTMRTVSGGGQSSSQSAVCARQTTVETAASSSMTRRALIRTQSSLVRRIVDETPCKSLEEVVEAFNGADDDEHRLGLKEVIRRVRDAFNEKPVRAVTDDQGAVVQEYLALCRLDSEGGEHLPLLKDFFDSLHNKLRDDSLKDRHLMEAMEHTLRSVDIEIFEDAPGCLVDLAQFVLDAFDPNRTIFSREMFPVQRSAMHALHLCLTILYDVAPGCLDPSNENGPYARFMEWCQKVIDGTGHYPAKHQAMLVQQSLTLLQSSDRGVLKKIRARRVAEFLYGTLGIYQAVRNAIVFQVDVGNLESTAGAFSRAAGDRIVRGQKWYKYLHALNAARFAAVEDPSAFGEFSSLFSTFVLEKEGSRREDCKVLRFGVLEMLGSLAIHGKNDAVRAESTDFLAGLVVPRDKWDWSSDPDLLLELLDNLAEIRDRGRDQERQRARDAIEQLKSNAHSAECEDALFQWQRRRDKTGTESVSSDQKETTSNKLFSQVWKNLKEESARPTTEFRPRLKKHHGLFSPLVVRHFAGRESECSELVEAFQSGSESVVVKAVVGPGGIGKSQVAAKVFESLKNNGNYEDAFWIPSDTKENLSAAFVQIAEYLELSTDAESSQLVRHVQEELERTRSLYVFDDAPNLEFIFEYLPRTNGHAIVTTRDSGATDRENDMVRLAPFHTYEAREVAAKFGYGGLSHAMGLEELIDILPRFPLALAQFFAMMKHEEQTPAEWLDQVRRYNATEREAELMEVLSAKQFGGEARGMVFVFNSSVRRISEESDGLGSHALDLLTKLALLDPNGVPIEWIYKWHGSEDRQSKTKTRKSLRLLERFSLVAWDREKNQVYTHAETQLLARHLLLNTDQSIAGKKEKCEEKARENARDHIQAIVVSIREYVDAFPSDVSNRERWASLARNGLPLLKHCEKCDDTDAEMILVEYMVLAYGKMCLFRESLTYSRRTLDMCERLHGDVDHPDLAACITNYAFGLDRTGKVNEALPLHKRAFEMCERLHGDVDHPDLAACIRNYAAGIDRTGRVNEALPLHKRALEMCERLHGDVDHPDLAACITNYAFGLDRTGRVNEALPLHKRAFEMYERLYRDADHPDLVACSRNYAAGLDRTGRVNEALPLHKSALEMCERLHGDVDHPDLAACITNYAFGLDRTGRVNEALPLHKRAFEMYERLYRDADHPDLVACSRNYASGLDRTGRVNEALPLHKRALEMCERLHGDVDHPDLAACITNYAFGLDRTGRVNEALPLHKRAFEMYERLYRDADHPDLVACSRNYASGLDRTGRVNEALPLHKSALEMCERLHGDVDHPDLAACITNYAFGLDRTGKVNEALPLRKRAFEMYERLYRDADHPDLVTCTRNYASGLDRTGRVNEALPLHKRALEMCERLHGDVDHPDLAACITNYAFGLDRTGKVNEALPLRKRAFEMCERLYRDADHPDLAACIRNYAAGLDRTGRVNEALPLHKSALEMCERLHGDVDHPDLAACITNYAFGLDRTGRVNEALPLHKRAFEMYERLYRDADHPDLVACSRNYASGLDRTGRVNEALPLHKSALEMCERLHGDVDHPDLAACITNYAFGLDRTGKVNEALPLRKRAFEMYERLYRDADHPDLVTCTRNYASGLDRTGRVNEALPLHKSALEMCERLHGDVDHPDLAACITNYAFGLDRTGKVNEALPLRKRAFEMCERLYRDADHPDLAACIRNYAAGLDRTGRVNEALPLHKSALEMCERLHGDVDHPDLAACITNYAFGLDRTGRVNEALPLHKRAFEMYERLYRDADHPDLVACSRNYAAGIDRTGRVNEALPLHKRALEMCERLHGDVDHPDLAACITNYAFGLDRTGRVNEALPLHKRAFEMYERLYRDADHPDLVACSRNYAAGLDDAGRVNEALPLHKRALEMCERLHGDVDHPDLAACITNYAFGLDRTGKVNEALPYFEKANAMMERLGKE